MQRRWRRAVHMHNVGGMYSVGIWSPFWKITCERLDPEHGHSGHSYNWYPMTPDVETQEARAILGTLAGEWPKHEAPFGGKGDVLYPKIMGYGRLRKWKPFADTCGRRCIFKLERKYSYRRARERRASRREYAA